MLVAVLAKNASVGLFIQTEEVLLLSDDERGQTVAVEIGWPFVVLDTEAHKFDFQWASLDGPMSIEQRVIYIAVDLAVAGLLTFTATRYLSLFASCCDWRVSISSLLAGVAVFATLIAEDKHTWWWRGGVGAASWATFRCVDAVILFGIATTWYWLLTAMGQVTGRVFHPLGEKM